MAKTVKTKTKAASAVVAAAAVGQTAAADIAASPPPYSLPTSPHIPLCETYHLSRQEQLLPVDTGSLGARESRGPS